MTATCIQSISQMSATRYSMCSYTIPTHPTTFIQHPTSASILSISQTYILSTLHLSNLHPYQTPDLHSLHPSTTPDLHNLRRFHCPIQSCRLILDISLFRLKVTHYTNFIPKCTDTTPTCTDLIAKIPYGNLLRFY